MNLKNLSLTFIVTAIGSLLLAGVSGAFGGLAILQGGMLGAIPGSMFISMHLTLGHLGWAVMVIIGLLLAFIYVTKTDLTYGLKWFNRIYWVYLAGIITAVLLIAFGYANETRYGEITWPFALLLMAVLGLFFILVLSLFRQTKATREIAIYYFLISIIYMILYFGIVALPLTGLPFKIALNIGTHLLFDGMMLAVMGLSVYILPRLVGRTLYSEFLSVAQLWMVLSMALMTCSRHLVRLNIMNGPTEFWAFFYNVLDVGVICTYYFNLYMSIRGAKPKEHKFTFYSLLLSNFYLAIVAFQGLGFLFTTIYRGQGAPKMLITLHAHFALFGFVTLGLVGALFYFLPKLIDGFALSDKFSDKIFYLLNGGMLLSFISTSLKNITPAEAHFGDHLTAETLKTYYLTAQYVGDTILLITSFLIAWAVAKNLVQVKLPVKRLAVALMLIIGLIFGNWWPSPFKTTFAQADGDIVAVANEGDSTVSILNGRSGKVIRMIKTGGSPHNVNFDPLGRYLWITDHSESGRILGYSLKNFQLVKEVSLPGAVGHVVPGYDGRHLYASVEGDDHLVVVDIETFQVIKKIDTEVMPHGLVISSDQSVLLVPNMMSDSVSVIEMESGETKGIINIGTADIHAIKSGLQGFFKHDHQHGSQQNRSAGGESNNSGQSMPGHDMSKMENMTMPVAMGISSNGAKAYVSLAGTHQVVEIDVKGLQATKVVDLPGEGEIGPIQLPVHPNGKYLYVPSMSEGKVFKIELENFTLVKEIVTGAGAHGIAYSNGGRFAYVTNTYDNSVSCIDTLTDEIVFVEKVGIAPNGVTVLKGKNQGW